MGEQLFKQCPNCNEFSSVKASKCENCDHSFVDDAAETPRKKGGSCGQRVLILLSVLSAVVFIALITIVFFFDDGTWRTGQSIAPDVESQPTATPLSISAKDLISEYEANEIAADGKYKDKVLDVRGDIKDFGVGLFEQKYVSLSDGKDYSFNSLRCNFEDENASQLIDLAKGHEVVLRGLNSGMLFMSVSLDNCIVVASK